MPRSLRLFHPFYGWYIVAASFIISFFVVGIVFYGFTTIFKPIVEEFGWSYAQVSLAASLRGVESGLLAPLVGILIDRWGPRRLVFFGGLLTALGLFMLSRIDSLVGFYIAFALIAIAMSTCSITVLMTTISNWFRKKVGLAMSIVSCGFGAGGLMVFVMSRLVDSYGWRDTVHGLAFGVLIITLPLSLLLRHKPQQYGYLADGETVLVNETSGGKVTVEIREYGITIQQALRTRTFWLMAVMFICHHLMVSTVVTHVMPYLTSVGISTTIASFGASGIPLASILGRMGFGSLGDRVNRRKLMVLMFAMTSLGLLAFQMVGTFAIAGVIAFLALFGVGYGGFNAIRPAFAREVFGTRQYGTIFGCLVGMGMLGNIAGPYIAGKMFDIQGSYQNVWLIFVAVALIALFSTMAIKDKESLYDDKPVG
jgi:MFS family permease